MKLSDSEVFAAATLSGKSALLNAIATYYSRSLVDLIEDNKCHAFHLAVLGGHLTIVKYFAENNQELLVEAIADSKFEHLNVAFKNNDRPMLECLITIAKNNPALMQYAPQYPVEVIKLLEKLVPEKIQIMVNTFLDMPLKDIDFEVLLHLMDLATEEMTLKLADNPISLVI
ncbi:MAG: hypothetical protein WC785_02030 [Tatlockia sp.]|jgi:hypothetical protein